jgi:hypothetical protein
MVKDRSERWEEDDRPRRRSVRRDDPEDDEEEELGPGQAKRTQRFRRPGR